MINIGEKGFFNILTKGLNIKQNTKKIYEKEKEIKVLINKQNIQFIKVMERIERFNYVEQMNQQQNGKQVQIDKYYIYINNIKIIFQWELVKVAKLLKKIRIYMHCLVIQEGQKVLRLQLHQQEKQMLLEIKEEHLLMKMEQHILENGTTLFNILFWIGICRDGFGTQVWPDGAQYEGQWKDDKAQGKGIFKHADGDIYDGEWENDKANGYGTYIHADGSKYEGLWKDDKQHGYGTETWVDGSKYEGNYKYGMKNGSGTYYWPDGKIYQGLWLQNKMTGYGVCHWKDGRCYIGEWLDNNMHGHGKYTTPDGKQYEGDYYFDKKHGFGTFTWPDGKKYSGNWKKGKQHGKGKIIVDKIEKHGMWEDGKRIRWIEDED
ncbi:unnamed protein product [Paramecium sonneborni]|uniref:MORN repeat protein n=1 Tax=Paramecium sonneborni TaxID=65129 RepID=A0A8S1R2K4_9CILI|nr:unnamed protein product [Paramecium sonneborni]